MRTVAEGVEHPAQASMVTDLGCEFAQGFLWSKPLPPTAFAHWLETRAVGSGHHRAGDLAQIPLSDARR
jgi:EAL domain-containing protein (putative c-di-GMP-specific phosphodiesterase class I)